jgi:CheY-like chemotaxis protein
VAENGKQALAALDARTFDLVLMDMQMPEVDGAEAMTIIRDNERTRGGHIPIIALTAHALKGDRERCLEAGADGYVSKPMTRARLFEEIDRVLGRRHRPPMPSNEPSVNAGLLARVGGDPKVLEEVIRLFLEDCPRLMGALAAGLADGNTQSVHRAAHALKGSAGNFDAIEVCATAQRLEARAREGDLEAARTLFSTLEAQVRQLLADLTATGASLRRAS